MFEGIHKCDLHEVESLCMGFWLRPPLPSMEYVFVFLGGYISEVDPLVWDAGICNVCGLVLTVRSCGGKGHFI